MGKTMTFDEGKHLTKFALGVAAVALLLGCGSGASGDALIEDRYRIEGSNGDIVLDTVTGLKWQRCSLGQTWNGSICIREATTYDWSEAHMAGDQVFGWRLPTKDELRTLVYCSNGNPARFKDSDERCYGDYQTPAIVQQAFPNTPSSGFWSGSGDASHPSYAWGVSFGRGFASDSFNRKFSHHVRLVQAQIKGPPAPFSADWAVYGGVSPGRGHYFASPEGVRVEGTDGGQSFVAILNAERVVGLALIESDRGYIEYTIEVDDFHMIGLGWVVSPCPSDAPAMRAGSATIDGRETEKWTCGSPDHYTMMVWYDPLLEAIIRYEDEFGYGELTNIRKGRQPASLFAPPRGYSQIEVSE